MELLIIPPPMGWNKQRFTAKNNAKIAKNNASGGKYIIWEGE